MVIEKIIKQLDELSVKKWKEKQKVYNYTK